MATPEPVEPVSPTGDTTVEPAGTTVPSTDDAEPRDREPDGRYSSREAASYRRRLRDTESERDALRTRVDEYERREVESLANHLGAAAPADLWTLVQLEELRVDGVLDTAQARERVSAILRERPTWRRSTPDLGAGARGGSNDPSTPGLADLLGKRRA